MKTKTQKVLVTGAGGFIGSHLAEKLCAQGRKVRAMIHYNSRNHWGWLEGSRYKTRLEVIAGDVRDADSVRSALAGVTTVYHLAALIGIPYSYTSPQAYVETNVNGVLNIMQAAMDAGVKKVVLTSTSEIYGTAQYVPIDEKHPINPQSPYAATKAGADQLAVSFHRSFGLPVAVMRPFNTYGPRQSARAVIPTIISQMLSGSRLIRLGSLKPTRDLTYVEDTVDGFIRCGDDPHSVGEVINLGTRTEIAIGDLARLIARLLKTTVHIECDHARQRPGASEVERLLADNSKAGVLLGWQPRFNLEQGLNKTIVWFRKNMAVYKPDLYTI